MTAPDFSLFASLREAYEASRRVRTPEDLEEVLAEIARLISDTLGWRAVAFNVHRRAWDDFETIAVHGPEAARELLLGTTQTWSQWAPLFRERFERRGAHLIPEEAGVTDDLETYVPPIAPSDAPGAWKANDELYVLMRGGDGEVTGILSVDEPRSGARPSDEEIDALVAVANAAGAALQQAREAAAQAQHQNALQQLLAVSAQIADARSDADVLDAVCRGISEALGFERVAIELADDTGAVIPAAWVGWETRPPLPIHIDRFAKILRSDYEDQGCYVLDHGDALRILGLPDAPYRSQRNGRGPWAWHRLWLCVPLRTPDGELTGFIWADDPADFLVPDTARLQALRLFADQAQAALEATRHYEQTLHLAQHDTLTGLPNRAVLLDRLREALHRPRRDHRTIAVLFVDVDRFKTINDTHGHDVGDEVLRGIAARIEDSLRPGDTVARMGGDEFAVLCEDVRGQDAAAEVARRLRRRLSEPMTIGHRTFNVTASVGVSLPAHREDDAQSVLHFADVAMYRAKEAGRDAQELASADLRAGASSRARLEQALVGALERGEIDLHWQPVVGLADDRIVRAEALMRWTHPEIGPVSPLEFIPLAEDNGTIVELGRWALTRACEQWACWQAHFGVAAPGVAVNLSPRQLRDAGLCDHVAALLARHGMEPSMLTFEVTEGVLLESSPVITQTLARLRRLGCPVELDDFGTGFSSLSLLADFNVDGLKIDRRFVSGGLRGRDAAIAEGVLAMARALDLRTTAEGVETREQLEWLRERGCPQAQGFLFSPPVPGSELTELLAMRAPDPAPPSARAAASTR